MFRWEETTLEACKGDFAVKAGKFGRPWHLNTVFLFLGQRKIKKAPKALWRMLWAWFGIFSCMSNGECAISYCVINIQCIVDQQADVNRPFLFERAHRKLLNHHLFWDVGRALDSVWRVLSINVCSFQIQSLVQEIYRIVTPAICWESNQLSPIGYCREIGNARNGIFKYKYFEYNVLRFRKKQQLICHSAGKETVALLPWIPVILSIVSIYLHNFLRCWSYCTPLQPNVD